MGAGGANWNWSPWLPKSWQSVLEVWFKSHCSVKDFPESCHPLGPQPLLWTTGTSYGNLSFGFIRATGHLLLKLSPFYCPIYFPYNSIFLSAGLQSSQGWYPWNLLIYVFHLVLGLHMAIQQFISEWKHKWMRSRPMSTTKPYVNHLSLLPSP